MTLEQKKLIACAELDGLTHLVEVKGIIYNVLPEQYPAKICPDYPNSLDAIVPVVIKWVDNDIENADKFFNELAKILPIKEGSYNILACWLLWTAKPSQIRDALLLAAEKMPEGGG